MVRGHETIAVGGHDSRSARRHPGDRGLRSRPSSSSSAAASPPAGAAYGRDAGRTRRAGLDRRAGPDELCVRPTRSAHLVHRIQMIRGRADPAPPTGTEALTALALFAGFPTWRPSRRRAAHHAAGSRRITLLFEAGRRRGGTAPPWSSARASRSPRTGAARRLRVPGSAPAWETVQGWHLGRRPALRTAGPGRSRRGAPGAVRALGGTADPDAALLALDRAFARMPAVAESLAILRSHERPAPPVRRHPGDGTAPRRTRWA